MSKAKLLTNIQTDKNNNNLKLTMNANYIPYEIDKTEKEWDEFKKLVYKNIRARLINIILRMYKWKLPDTMNERIIEYGFLERGWICIFKDPMGIFALPAIPKNMYNIYGEPTQVQAMGYNGWNEVVDIKYFANYPEVQGMQFIKAIDGRYGVTVRDNYANKLYIDYVDEFAKVLTDNRMAIMIATDTLKQPHITVVPKRALKKTAQKVIRAIQENKRQIIVVDEDVKSDNMSMRDIINDIDLSGNVEAPKKLVEIYNANFNLFLETIGINTNPSPDKSQVVLNAELYSNNSLIDLEQDVRFLQRKKLCEEAKKILGVDIDVEKNIQEMKELIDNMRMKGAEEDESKSTTQDSE